MGQILNARLTRLQVARRAMELDLPLDLVASLLETSVINLRRGRRLRRILDGELELSIDESAFERWSDGELLEAVENWRKRKVRADEPDVLKEPALPSQIVHASERVSATSAPSSLATPAAFAAATAAPTTTEPVAVRVHEHLSPASASAPTASTAKCDVEPISRSNELVSALEDLVPLATIDGIVVIGPHGLNTLASLSPSAAVAFLRQYDISWNLDLVTLTRAAIAALSFGVLTGSYGYRMTWRDHVLDAVDTATGLPTFMVPPKVGTAWSQLADGATPDAYEHEAVEATKVQLKESMDAVLADRATTDEARKARDLLTAVGLPDPQHLPLPPSEWANRTAAEKTKRYLEQQWQQQDDDQGAQFWWHRSHEQAVLNLLAKPLPWGR
jgi:hypothetical protein